MLLRRNFPVVAWSFESLFGANTILGPDVMAHDVQHLHGTEAAAHAKHESRCVLHLQRLLPGGRAFEMVSASYGCSIVGDISRQGVHGSTVMSWPAPRRF